ncbi:uncharacterized protein LOC109854020 [Pseudomyrmex gracilis]|uniref:uncharacterized protein LOC109854020 n=1 Tax=Pseudomyrmex gracilis TaxID=219809 RepID=UPI000994E34C|nr:uncharacterized protein LOC109854020 [Pseudomyrmex gracilis]
MAYKEQLDGKLGDDHMEVKEEPILQCYVQENSLPSFENTNAIPSSDVGGLYLWSSKATTCLINQYKKYRSLVGKSPHIRSLREMFEMISLEMQNYGFCFSPQKCENKWRVLVRKYKTIAYRERLKKPGRIKHYGQWEHKRALDEIFNSEKKKHNMYFEQTDSQLSNESTKCSLISRGCDQDSNHSHHPLKIRQHEDLLSSCSDATKDKDASNCKQTLTLLFEKFIGEVRESFAQAERNKERRHKEKLAMKQKELELKRQLLKLKEQKMQLQKCQMIAAVRNLK